MIQKGNFHLTADISGFEKTIICGTANNDVIQTLYELNRQATKETPFLIKRVFFVALNSDITYYKVSSDNVELSLTEEK